MEAFKLFLISYLAQVFFAFLIYITEGVLSLILFLIAIVVSIVLFIKIFKLAFIEVKEKKYYQKRFERLVQYLNEKHDDLPKDVHAKKL